MEGTTPHCPSGPNSTVKTVTHLTTTAVPVCHVLDDSYSFAGPGVLHGGRSINGVR